MRRLALVLVAAWTLVACSGDDGEPTASSGPPAAPAGPTGPVLVGISPLEVELAVPGEDPRRRLAHDLAAGSTSEAALDFRLSVEGVTAAAVTGASAFTVEEVGPGGSASATYALEGLDIAVSAGGGEPSDPVPDVLDVTGTLEVERDRVVTAATVETSSSGEIPGVDAVAASLDPRLTGLLLPFPREPVGPGATWSATGPLPLFGTSVDLTAELQLVERRANRFVITAAVTMASPGGGTGPVIDLEGIGRLEGDLTRLALRRGTVALAGSVVLPDRGPDELPMTLDLTIGGR